MPTERRVRRTQEEMDIALWQLRCSLEELEEEYDLERACEANRYYNPDLEEEEVW